MENSYIALDLETTGLNPKRDQIIEIGAVKIISGEIAEEFSTKINPRRKIPNAVINLTHITDAMVEDAPDMEAILPEFLLFCGDFPLVGHHIIFDFSFIKRSAVNMGYSFEKQGIDTLKLARILLPWLKYKNLKAVCDYYDIFFPNAHQALADAKAAHYIYQKMKKQFLDTDNSAFQAMPLIYKVKKESMATKRQKQHLNDLIKYHRIEMSMDINYLTRNEASRIIDLIILQYGRINKKR